MPYQLFAELEPSTLHSATMMRSTGLTPTSPIRIARPSRDLAAAERFYVDGLGLGVLYRHDAGASGDPPEWSLLMVGLPGAAWHLELTHDPRHPLAPTPTTEDLLVLYLARPVDEGLVGTLLAHGGERVAAHNPYWDRWGVTVADPDGYRLVLCERDWRPA